MLGQSEQICELWTDNSEPSGFEEGVVLVRSYVAYLF